MAISTFKRYEKKFIVPEEKAKLLLPYFEEKTRPDGYCVDGKYYTVYNIYYDNDNNDVIRHSTSKPYYKEKLRLRTYALGDENAPVFLELKKKIGKIVSKRRISMSREEYREFLATKNIPSHKQQIAEELRYYLKTNDVDPKVYIRYDRRALFGIDDPTLRITFDKNIKTRRANLNFDGDDSGRLILDENMRLLEIKFDGAMPLWIARLLSELEIYSRGFSKYGTEYHLDCMDKNKSIHGAV